MEIHNAIYLLFLLFFPDTVADVHILQVLTRDVEAVDFSAASASIL